MSAELAELAETSEDSAAARRKEPYRRAITGMYSRLARTASELDHVVALRQPIVEKAPYASAAEFGADLAIITRSLRETNAGIVARGRLRSLERAVDVFISRRSTSGRVRMCTSARWPSSSARRRRGSTTGA
jgi:phosphoenolpyruvate carboxylase